MKLHELKSQYKQVYELSIIASLVVVTLLFRALNFGSGNREVKKPDIIFEVSKIDLTKQIKRPPPPSRPVLPIASERENLLGDETIDETDVDLQEIPPPPPPPPKNDNNDESDIFVAYDSPPDLIGGYDFIKKNLKYPELARQAGIEGKALIKAIIDEKGNVLRTEVLKEDGNVGFGQAAADVVLKCHFKPAMQRDKPVKVSITIPVTFRLKGG